MQYVIPVTFADDTGFVEGLTPTITIRQRDERELEYIDIASETMEDKGLGDYVYVFINYDKYKLYTFKIDGGNDDLTSRYSTANNEIDYHSNKEDWGIQVRGAIGGYTRGINGRMERLEELLQKLDSKELDFSNILELLNEIKDKEFEVEVDDSEVLEKLEELSERNDKMEIISAMKENGAKNNKDNETNRELIGELVEQKKADRELIKKLEDYINILIKRGDIKKDGAFKALLKEIKEADEDIKELAIYMDEDFISLMNN